MDLGTISTQIYSPNQGLMMVEPSIVAVNQKTDRIVAVGKDAELMIGRTPSHINAIRPLENSVISNFEVAEEMLAYFLRKSLLSAGKKIFRTRLVVGVPSGITNVERRAIRDAVRNAGVREVYLVEETMAAALGIGLPINDPVGNMIVDMGGGTTDIAVISLGGVVQSKNINIAGLHFNNDIISYIRDEFKILIGEKTAEDIKTSIGTVIKPDEPVEFTVRGRDLVTGLPREVVITDSDIREAISGSVVQLLDSIKEVLEITPPEVVADIMQRGIILVGGGSLIIGLPELLTRELSISVSLAEEPHLAVVKGTGIILDDLPNYQEFLIDNEDELPPR